MANQDATSYLLPDGKIISFGDPFILNEVQYPANWLRMALPEDREFIGLKPVIFDERPDDRFYEGIEVDKKSPGKWNSQQRPVQQIRVTLIEHVKLEAAEIIGASFPDWKQRNMTAAGVALVEKLSLGKPLSGGEETARSYLHASWDWITSVRDHSNDLEKEINGLSFDDLIKWTSHDWPEKFK